MLVKNNDKSYLNEMGIFNMWFYLSETLIPHKNKRFDNHYK